MYNFDLEILTNSKHPLLSFVIVTHTWNDTGLEEVINFTTIVFISGS